MNDTTTTDPPPWVTPEHLASIAAAALRAALPALPAATAEQVRAVLDDRERLQRENQALLDAATHTARSEGARP